MDIISKRKIFYMISAVLLVPGLLALLIWGLRVGIDFTGGSQLELQFESPLTAEYVRAVLDDLGYDESTVQIADDTTAIIRTRELDYSSEDSTDASSASETEQAISEESSEEVAPTEEATGAETDETTPAADSTESGEDVTAQAASEKDQIIAALEEHFGPALESSFQTIGPSIGKALTNRSLLILLVAAVSVALYVGWAFREVAIQATSFSFAIGALVSILHDLLFLIGVFALLGKFLAVEVDGMFIIALVTVMGFSAYDSIVVFDRIREMLRKRVGEPFAQTVNDSILETLGRSVNVTMTLSFILLSLLLFGGASIRVFIFALLIGTVSAAYSSMFTAAPFLVDWQELADRLGKNPRQAK